jgi:DNA-binding transcriptional LysR family regulator
VLEEHLGCHLLTRTTRRMNLTEAGRIFYERCIDVVDALERAEASVAERAARRAARSS